MLAPLVDMVAVAAVAERRGAATYRARRSRHARHLLLRGLRLVPHSPGRGAASVGRGAGRAARHQGSRVGARCWRPSVMDVGDGV